MVMTISNFLVQLRFPRIAQPYAVPISGWQAASAGGQSAWRGARSLGPSLALCLVARCPASSVFARRFAQGEGRETDKWEGAEAKSDGGSVGVGV